VRKTAEMATSKKNRESLSNLSQEPHELVSSKAAQKTEPLSERTNKIAQPLKKSNGPTQASPTTSIEDLTSSLLKSQAVISNLKEQLNEKTGQLTEITRELEFFKAANPDPPKLAVQLEYTKKKLAQTEQKHSKTEVELAQTRAEMAQLQSALEIANRVIQSLQAQLQEPRKD